MESGIDEVLDVTEVFFDTREILRVWFCMGEIGSPTEGSLRIRFRRLISLRSIFSYLPAFDNAHGTRLVSVSLQRLDRLVYRFKHPLLHTGQ